MTNASRFCVTQSTTPLGTLNTSPSANVDTGGSRAYKGMVGIEEGLRLEVLGKSIRQTGEEDSLDGVEAGPWRA